MRFLMLTFVFGILNVFSSSPVSKFPSIQYVTKQISVDPTAPDDPVAANLILQSKDGGQTWQDISSSLPNNEEPEDFFAGASDIYLRVSDGMYHCKEIRNTPVWERVIALDPRCGSIAFNHSSVVAFNFDGLAYQEMSGNGRWLPIYTNMKMPNMRTVYETADGTIFLGFDSGLYKSIDRGQSWKKVADGGWVADIVEGEGVLVATSQKGIIRSTDNGEHWESVISEGGVGIAIERLEGGFAAISYNTRTQSRRIRISWDSGKTWNTIDDGLMPSSSISSIKQVGPYLFCGHPDGIYRSSDMGKTWKMVHESVEKSSVSMWHTVGPGNPGKVFKLYVSGNVLYAVARSAGC